LLKSRYNNQNKTVIIYGNDWENALDIYVNDLGWSLKEGKWPTPGKNEIVVGSLVATEIFPGLKIGLEEAIIKGRNFKIVGILNSLGSQQDDSMVYMDIDVYQDITGEKRGTAAYAMAKLEEGADENEVAESIEDSLKKQSIVVGQ